MICARLDVIDPTSFEFAVDRSEARGKVALYAFLLRSDVAIGTGVLTVPLGSPLDRCVATIIQAAEEGDNSLLQLLREKLLEGYPHRCKCPSDEECEALGSSASLKAALKAILRKMEGR